MGAEDPEQERHPPEPRVPLRIEQALAAAAMAALGLVTFANVIVRYFSDFSFAFTEEYSIALMVVVTMLGTGVAAAANRHVRITFFVELMRPHLRRWAEIVAGLATVAMFAIFVWLGGRLAYDEYRFEVTSPALGYPQWLYTAILPVLSIAIALRALGYVMRLLRRRSSQGATTDPTM